MVGGGLTTDVTGFACSAYRRGTNYIRVPTTLIGLIDASVAIKVAVNHGHLKNRLGAYHASQTVILDFSFLGTLPAAQVRNGMAELVKIGVVGNRRVFDLLDEHGEELLRHPLRLPRRIEQSCAGSRTSSRTRRSARCSTSRCPTCTSSTSTG